MTLDSHFSPPGFDAAEVWLSALRAAGRSPKTLANYTHAVNRLKAWRDGDSGDSDVTSLSKFEARRFVQYLTDNHAPGGVANRVRSLRALYGWLLNEEMIEANPFARVRISVPQEAKTTPSDEEINRMLARAKGNRRDVAMLTLLADTGCRKGEIAALTVADVDLTSGTVRFPVSKTTPRTVPLTDRAVVALGRWLRQRGVGGGSLWSVEAPYGLVANVVRRHSKGTLTPHALRRAFAVRFLSRGGSETSLMRLAGWTSLAMVSHYVRAHHDTLAADQFRKLMNS